MTIQQRGIDLDRHATACKAMSDDSLRGIVNELGNKTLREKWERLRLKAAQAELNRRRGVRR